jgi:geranylgeranyl diphosphate synthase type I
MLSAIFERYRAEIDAELKSILTKRKLPLYDMLQYHMGWVDAEGNPMQNSSGKALRPTLCLLAYESIGGDYHKALPAAAAIELIHNYSLIHDDIQDDDEERRHRPTVWIIWGKPQAINAGTAMRLLANLILARLRKVDFPLEKQLRIQSLIDDTTIRLVEGQYLDISFENRFDIKVDDYLEMIEGKTAALISCALETGSLLGTDDGQITASFRDIGRSLGLAFQIRDDILGIWGEGEKIGKPLGSDILHRKKTLPIVYALEKTGNTLRKELIDIYQNGTFKKNELATVLNILESVDAQANAQEMAEKYCADALQTIDSISLVPSAKKRLKEMFHFLIERSF